MPSRILALCLLLSATVCVAQTTNETTIIRPREIQDVLVNPGMGIQTFQRFNGDPLNENLRWSEEGPTTSLIPAANKQDFPRAP